jgi:hypothetical protein
MTRYWVVALIVAVLAMLLLVRRVARRHDTSAEDRALVPHGDGERELVEFDPLLRGEVFSDRGIDDPGDLDDTAPAVLSPPEWTAPKSASNGTRR